ncbi:MAG: adenylate/guanylate cyclase domain-containing protein [Acidimicrobiia bacterium]|nr:adenylate/guanylate cyclase domain-containing protein [Acidimicrobiia bacterium]
MNRSEVRYARSGDGIDIAFQVIGEGPVDLVFVSGFITHLDLAWELPHFAWLEQLDGFARVITFDKRGTGLSDRSLGFGSLEERTSDIDAVMRAAGSERAYLVGMSEGGPMSILFAATNPERVAGLVLFGTTPRFSRADDWPSGLPREQTERFLEFIVARWGTGEVFEVFLQNSTDSVAARPKIARFERNACTPKMAGEIMRRNFEIDVRTLLPTISVPTLVIHATDDPVVPVAGARHLARQIPDARLTELPGSYHASWDAKDVAALRDAVVEFIATDRGPAINIDRVLSTVLFTDIVSSTEAAGRVGDKAWRSLLDTHDRISSTAIERQGGHLVKNTGDGLLATFDGPSRAVACAQAVMTALRTHDLQIRAGVHTGEIELRSGEQQDVTGVGVVIASRICDLAAAGEILVSRTVKDLVSGSVVELDDRGAYPLKGLSEPWHLYAATIS